MPLSTPMPQNAEPPPTFPPGSSLCYCVICRQTFARPAGFDKHLTGEYYRPPRKSTRRCRTPTEMRAIGMGQNAKGWWVTKLAPGAVETDGGDGD